ncbi:uncharacterized protein G2W53_039960 [Senna tora]|uniref:Uncharacterized protein n=1 Tax=Senna tora TaxID=362788 RepID=A0A834W8E3_9FABA|nr:uncharacterized protein G2W53_039960 [Senna tora]
MQEQNYGPPTNDPHMSSTIARLQRRNYLSSKRGQKSGPPSNYPQMSSTVARFQPRNYLLSKIDENSYSPTNHPHMSSKVARLERKNYLLSKKGIDYTLNTVKHSSLSSSSSVLSNITNNNIPCRDSGLLIQEKLLDQSDSRNGTQPINTTSSDICNSNHNISAKDFRLIRKHKMLSTRASRSGTISSNTTSLPISNSRKRPRQSSVNESISSIAVHHIPTTQDHPTTTSIPIIGEPNHNENHIPGDSQDTCSYLIEGNVQFV